MGCGASSNVENVTSPESNATPVKGPNKVSSNAFGTAGRNTAAAVPSVRERPPPPTISLADPIPHEVVGQSSQARPPGEPPFERVLLISSRVAGLMKVAGAALPKVAYITYDWKNNSPEQLVSSVQSTLGNTKVASLGILDPSDEPNVLGVLKSSPTTVATLSSDSKISKMWKDLVGFMDAVVEHEGTRVDLIGCGVMTQPEEGAKLLKTLHETTGVRFAGSDDSERFYRLSTYFEKTPGKMSVINSGIKGLELYVNTHILQSSEQEAFGTAVKSSQETAGDESRAATAGGIAAAAPAIADASPIPPKSSPDVFADLDPTAADTAKVASSGPEASTSIASTKNQQPVTQTVPNDRALDTSKATESGPGMQRDPSTQLGFEVPTAIAAGAAAAAVSAALPASSAQAKEGGNTLDSEAVGKVASAGMEGGTPAAMAAAQDAVKDLPSSSKAPGESSIPGSEAVGKVASAGMEGGTPAAVAAAQDVAYDLGSGLSAPLDAPAVNPAGRDDSLPAATTGLAPLPSSLPPMGTVKG